MRTKRPFDACSQRRARRWRGRNLPADAGVPDFPVESGRREKRLWESGHAAAAGASIPAERESIGLQPAEGGIEEIEVGVGICRQAGNGLLSGTYTANGTTIKGDGAKVKILPRKVAKMKGVPLETLVAVGPHSLTVKTVVVAWPVDQPKLVRRAKQLVYNRAGHDVGLVGEGEVAFVVLPAVGNRGRPRRNQRQHTVAVYW